MEWSVPSPVQVESVSFSGVNRRSSFHPTRFDCFVSSYSTLRTRPSGAVWKDVLGDLGDLRKTLPFSVIEPLATSGNDAVQVRMEFRVIDMSKPHWDADETLGELWIQT